MSAASRQAKGFSVYLELGPQRSLAKVAETIRSEPAVHGFRRAPSLRTVEEWSARYRWGERLAAIEREAQEAEAREHVERVKDHHARLRQEGLFLQQKGIAALDEMAADDFTAREAIRAIGEGFRLESLSLGEASEHIHLEEDYGHVTGRLSDEELDRLVALLRDPPPAPDGAVEAQS